MICKGLGNDAADRDLEGRVKMYLDDRQVRSLGSLEVNCDGGVVTMRGRVRSFYEKQLAIHCCQRVAGVLKLIDGVEVNYA